MMEIELEFRSDPPGARPIWLTVKTKDSRILELDWEDEVISHGTSDKSSFTAFGLHCPDDGNYQPDRNDFDGSVLVDASWRDKDENPFGGAIEILSAAVSDDDGEKITLAGTPLSLPVPIDYTKLDRAVRDAVKYFNQCGLRTKSSYGGQGLMQVTFHRSVCEMDLRNFPGGQPKEGRFCIMLEPGMKYAFAYIAPTPAAVSRDLGQWQINHPIGGKRDET